MKQLYSLGLIFLLWTLTVVSAFAQESDSLKFKKACELHENKEYTAARTIFEQLYTAGYRKEVTSYNLGVFYEYGQGVKKDMVRAYDYYSESALLGFALAQNTLGSLFYYGDNISSEELDNLMRVRNLGPFTEDQALKWYRMSARQKDPRGLYLLGLFYAGAGCLHEYYMENGSPYDLFKESAQLGDFWAIFWMAYCESGYGNYTEAKEWLKEVEKQNSAARYCDVTAAQLTALCDYFQSHPLYRPAVICEDCDDDGLRIFTAKYKDEGIAVGIHRNNKIGTLLLSPSGKITECSPCLYDHCSYDKEDSSFYMFLENKDGSTRWSAKTDIYGMEVDDE